MNLIDKVTALLPFGKPPQQAEHFFALNITPSRLTAAVWTIFSGELKVLDIASSSYSSTEEIVNGADKLLDQVLGEETPEPEKILFGVPDSWLLDDDLKEPYLKLLRNLVKSLDIKPMAYVSTSHAIAHLLEKVDHGPVTAIFLGIEEEDVAVTVSRAGKIDGTKIIKRVGNIGEEIEKALLAFSEVEVLPSRMLVYNPSEDNIDLSKQKDILLAFPWMSKLSFLHFPKIEVLEEGLAIKAVALAGAIEMEPNVRYVVAPMLPGVGERMSHQSQLEEEPVEEDKETNGEELNIAEPEGSADDLGFGVGDVLEKTKVIPKEESGLFEDETLERTPIVDETAPVVVRGGREIEMDVETSLEPSRNLANKINSKLRLLIPVFLIAALCLAYLFLFKARISVFVEPRVLEKDTQVTADPSIKVIDEEHKKIPGQVVETEISGTDKIDASGKKQIGDPARGTVTIYNKTFESKSFSKGASLTGGGVKFTLDNQINVASQSAIEGGISFGKVSADVTASEIGADGNLPSGTEFTISSLSADQYSAKSSGNFSGGTSKDVTVVTDSDQKKLLASLASDLRKQATDKLQAKLQGKKVLEESLEEKITKKSYSKNINDQTSEFSLNLSISFKGIAYLDEDLKMIVSKLVETNVPEGFELNLAETETQADVFKVEGNKLTFLARFKAKLMPKIDTTEIKKKIKGKTPSQAAEILKSYDNVLSSEIKINPSLPTQLVRLPFLERNIQIEVKLK